MKSTRPRNPSFGSAGAWCAVGVAHVVVVRLCCPSYLRKYIENSQTRQAMVLYARMEEAGVRPSVGTWAELVNLAAAARQVRMPGSGWLVALCTPGLVLCCAVLLVLALRCRHLRPAYLARRCAEQRPASLAMYVALMDSVDNDITQLMRSPTKHTDWPPRRTALPTSAHNGRDNSDALISAMTYGRLVREACVRARCCTEHVGQLPRTCAVLYCARSRSSTCHATPSHSPSPLPFPPAALKQDQKQFHRAFQLFDDLREVGHEPNAAVVAFLMRACTDRALLDRAYSLIGELVASGVRPNEHTFLPLIFGHLALVRGCRCCVLAVGGVEGGQQWWLDSASPIVLDSVYSPVVSVGTPHHQGDLQGAMRVWDEMEAHGYRITSPETFSRLLSKCFEHGHGHAAQAVLARMASAGVKPNAVTYVCRAFFCVWGFHRFTHCFHHTTHTHTHTHTHTRTHARTQICRPARGDAE